MLSNRFNGTETKIMNEILQFYSNLLIGLVDFLFSIPGFLLLFVNRK